MNKRGLIVLSVLIGLGLLIACAQEKKPDYRAEISEKGKIVAEAEAQLAANKFDEAAATYQKALTELNALKQKVPTADPSQASLETMISGAKAKLDQIPAAKQQYEAKIAAEKKADVQPEKKPEVKPAAKPKASVEKMRPPAAPAKREAKPEVKGEAKGEAQTKAPEAVTEQKKTEPVKWKVVYRAVLQTGDIEWHILCGEKLTRVIKQDPKKAEKGYLAGYGGKSYDKLNEAAIAVCSQ